MPCRSSPQGPAYDPGPPDLDQLNADAARVGGIGNLPLHGATGAELAGFVPHRPARPEKSEGGIALQAGQRVRAGRRPADRDQGTGRRRANANERDQVLLGVTGSGKTFTMAKVIEAVQRPALILAPNKTLAAQLYSEIKQFFPENAVEYFVSYYDYYQPEAYIPRTDTYIEKDSSVNEEIDRMRHSATRAILERDDVIIVASVSCIYGIGAVETYSGTARHASRAARRSTACDLMQRALGAAIPAQRRQFRARRLPRARRHDRHLPGALRRPRLARRAVRRRGRQHHRVRSADRPARPATLDTIKIYANSHYVTPRPTLQQAMKGIKAELITAPRRFPRQRQAARSAAPGTAHALSTWR